MQLDTLSFKLKQICDFIIEETFFQKGNKQINDYRNFTLQLTEKVLQSRSGYYIPSTRTIQLSSVNKVYFHTLLITLLHELAHHIEFCDNGASGHSNNFYKIHLSLIFTAIDCKIISYDEIMDIAELSLSRNRFKLTKMLQEYIPKKNVPSIHTKCDLSFIKEYNNIKPVNKTIKIKCSIKDNHIFKNREYKWLEEEKIWYKTIYKLPEYFKEINFLTNINYICYSIHNKSYYVNEINFIVTGNTYKYKNELKKLGYRFNNKKWRKTISVKNHDKEISHLKKYYGLTIFFDFINKEGTA